MGENKCLSLDFHPFVVGLAYFPQQAFHFRPWRGGVQRRDRSGQLRHVYVILIFVGGIAGGDRKQRGRGQYLVK